MKWIIDRLDPDEESVYLKSVSTQIVRKISVPGALSASLVDGMLLIHAVTGHLWTVDPDTGHRSRTALSNGNSSIDETVDKLD